MMIFMSGYNEGKAQTSSISDCLGSCSVTFPWLQAPEFVKAVNCSHGPNNGLPCTFLVKSKYRLNMCYNPPLYEFTIDNISFTDNCLLGTCYDRSILTEATYWLLVDRYKRLELQYGQDISYISNVTGVNASCFIGNIDCSPTFMQLDVSNSSYTLSSTSFTNNPSESGNPNNITFTSATLTSQLNPCLNTSCCKVNYIIGRAHPPHNGNEYDVFLFNPQPIDLDCQGNNIFTICHPACHDFANFDTLPMAYYKGNIKNIDTKYNDFVKLKYNNNKLKLMLNNTYKGNLTILLYNIKSDLVINKLIYKNEENLEFEIGCENLAIGFYNILIYNDYGEVFHEKVNINR